jgi:alpha-L-rhamnosidase
LIQAIDGNHTGAGWGTGVGWNDATAGDYPDSLTINLNATQSLSEVDVYSLQDNYASPIEPTDATTFNYYGLTDFQVQVPDGVGGWVDVPGGHVTGNNLVRRRVVFASPVMTNQIRIQVNNTADAVYSRIVEVEALSCTPQAALPGLASEMSHGKETTTVSLK